jgi:tetratricopeptide (TPR) repeat protein
LLLQRGDPVAARPHLLQALALWREQGYLWYMAQALIDLGLVALWAGDPAAARDWYGQGLAMARMVKDRALEALALNNLGEAARLAGDDVQAVLRYSESLRLYRDVGSKSEIPRLLHNLGYLALHAGDLAGAREHFAESLAQFQALGSRRGMAEAIAGLAAVAAQLQTRQYALHAARLWGAAEALREAEGTPVWPTDRNEHGRYQALARAQISAPDFDAVWSAGRALSLDQALREALEPLRDTD